jgi:hypothetical protein
VEEQKAKKEQNTHHVVLPLLNVAILEKVQNGVKPNNYNIYYHEKI